ncbi:hypothetical protein [Tahibacter soli]|uniref:Uncharacterized protein n=1 Tax=Tahibacter soli TaxID=2983605 RepID=A0A9X3YMC2_9GAMM|nr:hypothetical protein [Tahibacter soli]MDC8013895.1 hypothetical protein [Tahibacter soli]
MNEPIYAPVVNVPARTHSILVLSERTAPWFEIYSVGGSRALAGALQAASMLLEALPDRVDGLPLDALMNATIDASVFALAGSRADSADLGGAAAADVARHIESELRILADAAIPRELGAECERVIGDLFDGRAHVLLPHWMHLESSGDTSRLSINALVVGGLARDGRVPLSPVTFTVAVTQTRGLLRRRRETSVGIRALHIAVNIGGSDAAAYG